MSDSDQSIYSVRNVKKKDGYFHGTVNCNNTGCTLNQECNGRTKNALLSHAWEVWAQHDCIAIKRK